MSTSAYARFVHAATLSVPQRRPLVSTGLGIEGWAPFAAAAAVAAVLSITFVAWTWDHFISDQATVTVDDLGEAAAALIAAASCAFAAGRNQGRVRVAWAFFALS